MSKKVQIANYLSKVKGVKIDSFTTKACKCKNRIFNYIYPEVTKPTTNPRHNWRCSKCGKEFYGM